MVLTSGRNAEYAGWLQTFKIWALHTCPCVLPGADSFVDD